METCVEGSCTVRLLGLGNELLADDAFGILVAREVVGHALARPCPPEVVCSSASGFHLLDQVLGTRRLVVVDTLATRDSVPGTIHVFRPEPGGSSAAAPHFVGIFDVLAAARRLGLDAPEDVVVIGVEAADCVTVGGEMHPDVRAAIGKAVEIVRAFSDSI